MKILFDGPFKGFYSLAIVNREVASLIRKSHYLSISAHENDIRADPYFVSSGLTSCLVDALDDCYDLHVRNTWPPAVDGMRGRRNAYIAFAWEETKFNSEFIHDFNSSLDFVVVVSEFCARALLSCGLRVPIYNVGNGVRLPNTQSSCSDNLQHFKIMTEPFTHRILHVSSGFWRKGPDILLKAFCDQFDHDMSSCLIIKTFSNPDNIVTKELRAVSHRPAYERIFVLECELPENDLDWLYRWSTCVALPSRGEGFLLPAAEAMLRNLPVITTGFSGQTDFCTSETSWLVDYKMIPSKSHVAPSGSMIANPFSASLAAQLERVHPRNPQDEVKRRTAAAFNRIHRLYDWSAVGQRVEHAISNASELNSKCDVETGIGGRVCYISTWNERCGIFEYTKAMWTAWKTAFKELAPVFTRSDVSLSTAHDESFVHRSGSFNFDTIDVLLKDVSEADQDIVILQHHLGYFSVDLTLYIADYLSHRGMSLIIIAHNPREWHTTPDVVRRLESYNVETIVHSPEDYQYFHELGFRRLCQLDHPIDTSLDSGPPLIRAVGSAPKIASFGFLLPHKGFDILLYSISELRTIYPDIHVTLLTASQGNIKSEYTYDKLIDQIASLNLYKNVSIDTNFSSQCLIRNVLSRSDLVVLPYFASAEGASGAVRTCISAGAPILTSDVSLFDGTKALVPQFAEGSVQDLTAMIAELLSDPSVRLGLAHRNCAYARELSWNRRIFAFAGVARLLGRSGVWSFVTNSGSSESHVLRSSVPLSSQDFGLGWHQIELNRDGQQFRWMSEMAIVSVPQGMGILEKMIIEIEGSYKSSAFLLSADVDGEVADVSISERGVGKFLATVRAMKLTPFARTHVIRISSSFFGCPNDDGVENDLRNLSIMVSGIEVIYEPHYGFEGSNDPTTMNFGSPLVDQPSDTEQVASS